MKSSDSEATATGRPQIDKTLNEDLMKKTFMVVDDDLILHYLVKRVCKPIEDIEKIYFANNGLEALELLKHWLEDATPSPTAIFVDINMPIMNGFEFIKEYKNLKSIWGNKLNSIIVAVLTSSTQIADKEKMLASGVVDEVIVKPDNPQALREIILKTLNGIMVSPT
ncbi:MAG: response regulator [Bdellovibrionia bacterium]